MKKNSIIKSFILLFSLFIVISTTFQSTLAFVVIKTETLTNTFEPLKDIVSDLIINKIVEHPFGDDYAIPGNIGFDFEIDLGSKYAGKTFDTTVGEKVADEFGVIVVNVKPGIPLGIQGIDENTKVIVKEIQKDDDGFEVKDEISSKEVIIPSGKNIATVDFVNIYKPKKYVAMNVNVTGSKILEGRDWEMGDTFTFLLEQGNGTGSWIPLRTKSVTYNPDNEDFNKFDFNDVIHSLEFTQAGTYSFRISEIVGDIKNITYDETIKYFDIVVGDRDMDGRLEIQNIKASKNISVEESDKYNIDVTFKNKFTEPDIPEPEAIEIPINVIKSVKSVGTGSIGPENFKFALENISTNERFILTSDEDGLFGFNVKFTSDDIGKTINYRLSEINDDREDIVYSNKVYDIKFVVALGADNKLVVTKYCNGVIVKDINVAFENIYSGESTIPDDPTEPTEPSTPTKPTEPTKPTDKPTDNQGNQGGSNVPQDGTTPPSQGKDVLLTGDTRNIVPMLVILVISGFVWITLLLSKKVKIKHNKK